MTSPRCHSTPPHYCSKPRASCDMDDKSSHVRVVGQIVKQSETMNYVHVQSATRTHLRCTWHLTITLNHFDTAFIHVHLRLHLEVHAVEGVHLVPPAWWEVQQVACLLPDLVDGGGARGCVASAPNGRQISTKSSPKHNASTSCHAPRSFHSFLPHRRRFRTPCTWLCPLLKYLLRPVLV